MPVPASPSPVPPVSAGIAQARIHFPGFTALRFLLSWTVLIFHVEVIKEAAGLPHRLAWPFFKSAGFEAVTCFFVLSGFLITYLLFAEKELTGRIAIRDFYLRRILRLWPVYYLVIALGFFVLPYVPPFPNTFLTGPGSLSHIGSQLFFYVLMMPNVADFLPATNFFTSHTWSIGVEEQFYLLWPWLLARTRRYGRVLLSLIALYLLIRLSCVPLRRQYPAGSEPYDFFNAVFNFLHLTRIDCMAIGGLAAWWFRYYKDRYLTWLSHPLVQTGAASLLVGTLFTGFAIPYLQQELKAVCFALILLGMAARPKRVQWLEQPVLRYLGNVSYGFYMYHPAAIGLGILLLQKSTAPGAWGLSQDVILYAGATLLTLLAAILSYELMERRFIRFKSRFARVQSRG